jgi:hypothetical protein
MRKLGPEVKTHGPVFMTSALLRSFVMKLFLPFVAVIWLALFVYFKFEPRNSGYLTGSARKINGKGNVPFDKYGNVFGPSQLYNELRPADQQYERLVIVPGHAVMNLEHLDRADVLDEAWYLLPYQRNTGFPQIIAQHTRAACDLTLTDSLRNRSVLIFSGGQTRRDVGPTSEAASYYYLAMHNHWLSMGGQIKAAKQLPDVTVYLEEYARDSFENLLFSICRYAMVHNVDTDLQMKCCRKVSRSRRLLPKAHHSRRLRLQRAPVSASAS